MTVRKPNKWERMAAEQAAQEAQARRLWSYCTSFCNHPHRRLTGKPVGHECYVLPPAALEAESDGNFDLAIEVLNAAKPMRVHRGERDLVRVRVTTPHTDAYWAGVKRKGK